MKTKTWFLSLTLVSALFFCAQAQEQQVEFGVLTYASKGMVVNGNDYEITISLNDTYTRVEGKKGDGGVMKNFSPVNQTLSELAKEGWVVYQTGNIVTLSEITHYFYLMRKKR